MQCEDCRATLNAYLDDELMPDERDAVRAHLASCEQCTAEHETLAALSRRLKDSLDRPKAPDVLAARIRASLTQGADADRPSNAAVNASAPPNQRALPWTKLIAAGIAIAFISSATSIAVVRQRDESGMVAEQVMSSHVRSLLPGHLTDIESNNLHNVKPWFNGRIAISPTVPRLDSLGFPLLGGRLDYIGEHQVAVVVYQRRQHVINVFSWPTDQGATEPSVARTEHGYHLVHWRDTDEEFWAASDLSAPELLQFVSLFTQASSVAAPQ